MNKLIQKKPVILSLRQVCLIKKTFLNTIKDHGIYLRNNAGRNNLGSITVFGKGGGHKKRYRIIFFERQDLSGIVESIEHDPYRSANIARLYSSKFNSHFYILAPQGINRGHFINSQIGGLNPDFKIGNLFYLKDAPLGTLVHNIISNFRIPVKDLKHQSKFYAGGFIRSAGCVAFLISKKNNICRVRLPSGEYKLFSCFTKVTLGALSNNLHNKVKIGKAGRSRWLNHRPTVRGVAMNPFDHPHGGGEGKTSGGRPSVTPWGCLTKGLPTRSRKKSTHQFSL
jgi:large subunit ribosomal protein L2